MLSCLSKPLAAPNGEQPGPAAARKESVGKPNCTSDSSDCCTCFSLCILQEHPQAHSPLLLAMETLPDHLLAFIFDLLCKSNAPRDSSGFRDATW